MEIRRNKVVMSFLILSWSHILLHIWGQP